MSGSVGSEVRSVAVDQMDTERGDVAALSIGCITCCTFYSHFLIKIKIHTGKFIKAEHTAHKKLCQNILCFIRGFKLWC